MNEFELIVSEGKKPIWKLVLASLLFVISIGLMVYVFDAVRTVGFDQLPVKFLSSNVKILGFALSSGVYLSMTKTILIDTDKNKLISRYFVGPFSKDVTSVVPELEYVSVFFDASDVFQVNLWYDNNKHYKMYTFDQKQPAMGFALDVATKLNIDLLDATKKGNSRWVEKD